MRLDVGLIVTGLACVALLGGCLSPEKADGVAKPYPGDQVGKMERDMRSGLPEAPCRDPMYKPPKGSPKDKYEARIPSSEYDEGGFSRCSQ